MAKDKTYTEQLAEWVGEREKTQRRRQDQVAVQVLAARAEIKEAMDAGYALKTIWQHMNATGRAKCRYETFLRHVRKHITGTSIRNAQKRIQKKNAPSGAPFEFNPTPSKEELV
jgi:hypothetical protein